MKELQEGTKIAAVSGMGVIEHAVILQKADSENKNDRGVKANPGIVALKCESCGADLLSPDEVMKMPLSKISTYLKASANCGSCNHVGRPVEVSVHKSGDTESVIKRGSIANYPVRLTRSGVMQKQNSQQFNISYEGITPKPIEEILTTYDEIDQAMIYGHGRPYLVALIYSLVKKKNMHGLN